MRLVSRSLRRRNQACKYIHVHVHVLGHLQLYTCTFVLYMYILLCCHGNNRFSSFVHVHVQCMSPCRMWNISMDFLSANTPHFLRLWLDTGLSFTAKLMYSCARCTTVYLILLHEERHQKTSYHSAMLLIKYNNIMYNANVYTCTYMYCSGMTCVYT